MHLIYDRQLIRMGLFSNAGKLFKAGATAAKTAKTATAAAKTAKTATAAATAAKTATTAANAAKAAKAAKLATTATTTAKNVKTATKVLATTAAVGTVATVLIAPNSAAAQAITKTANDLKNGAVDLAEDVAETATSGVKKAASAAFDAIWGPIKNSPFFQYVMWFIYAILISIGLGIVFKIYGIFGPLFKGNSMPSNPFQGMQQSPFQGMQQSPFQGMQQSPFQGMQSQFNGLTMPYYTDTMPIN
jgi:hypothetical protein